MWWISIAVLGAMFIIAAIGFCTGYMVAEMRCTKKLEKALEEMKQELEDYKLQEELKREREALFDSASDFPKDYSYGY